MSDSKIIVCLASGVLLLAGGLTGSLAAELDDARFARVNEILERLEASPTDPLRPVAPATDAPEEISDLETRRSLVIARAVRTLETSVDTTLALLEGDVLTPLSLARNYGHLGMRGRALRWYEGALTADKNADYTTTIHREMAVCVSASGDSARIVEMARRLLRQPTPEIYSVELARLLVALAGSDEGREILALVGEMDDLRPESGPELQLEIARFWLAHEEPARAQRRFAALLDHPDRLPLEVAARTLEGLADSSAQMGEADEAVALFQLYQQRDAGRLSAWSTYRLGQLAVNGGRLGTAERHFRSICEREEDTPWREDACTQLAQTRQLIEIDQALQPYGLRLHMNRESAR